MREILFRGQLKSTKKWVYGDLVRLRDGNKEIPHIYGFGEVIPETVGQYTGLYDKNRNKIFEGDIVRQKTTKEFKKYNCFEWERYGIVMFGTYDFDEGEAGNRTECWYLEPLKSISIFPSDYLIGGIQAGLNQIDILDESYPFEIIGNIHDNPELLKKMESESND